MSPHLMPPTPPDDENTAMLVLLASGHQAAAWLRALPGSLCIGAAGDACPDSPIVPDGVSVHFFAGADDVVFARSAGRGGSAPVELTPREFQILTHIATGQSTRLISRRLFVSESTVKAHLTRLYTKFGVDNRTAAVVAARRQGLLPD